jgi:transposase-like protein
MKKSHKVSLDVKEQILNRIKNEGLSVKQVAEEHGLNTRTIYSWLSRGVAGQPSLIEYSKLKKENQVLKEMLGEVTMELKRSQKKD